MVVHLVLVRRMSRQHALALAVAVALSGCHRDGTLPATSRDAEALRWLDHADVSTDFTERVESQRDLRFASVLRAEHLKRDGPRGDSRGEAAP